MSVEYAERLYKDDDESEFVLGGGGCISTVGCCAYQDIERSIVTVAEVQVVNGRPW